MRLCASTWDQERQAQYNKLDREFYFKVLNCNPWPRERLLACSCGDNMPRGSHKRDRGNGVGKSTTHTSGVSSEDAAEVHSDAGEAHHAVPGSVDSTPLPTSAASTPEPKRGKVEPDELTLTEMQENIVKLITQHLDQKINSVNEKMDSLLIATTENKNKIEDLAQHSEFIYQQLQDTNKKVEALEKLNKEHKHTIAFLEDQVNRLEGQQRRQNLRLCRLREEPGEDLKKMVTDICHRTAPEEEWLHVDICHRVGPKEPGRTRPVIIRFGNRSDRDAVWKCSRDSEFLKTKGLYFKEDFTSRDREARMELWPQVKEAKDRGIKAFYVGPKAIINGIEVRAKRK